MDSAVPSECCVCGVPIGVKGGVGGTLQATSGLWLCFARRCWRQHEAVFCPDNERLMAIVNRRRDAESDARMAAHLYADALEHAMRADAERDTATARAERAERERDEAYRAAITAADDFANATGRVCQSNIDLRTALREARAWLQSFANDIDDEQAWTMENRGREARELQRRIDALLRDDKGAP